MQPIGRPARRRALLAVVAGCLAPVARARAAVDPRLGALGWQEMTFRDKPGNTYMLEPDGSIRIESRASVSVLWLELPSDPLATPILRWRWRIDQAVPPTDLRRRGGDDRSLAVHVAFSYVAERASLLERSVRTILGSIAGRELPGRLLTYVWGGDGGSPGWFDNPYLPTGNRIRVLRGVGAPTGAWLEERVDIAADFREAFGEEPTQVVQVGVGADSDDTLSAAHARVGAFTWLPRG
jgi:hypothetical protein